jgi:hypothetical protein
MVISKRTGKEENNGMKNTGKKEQGTYRLRDAIANCYRTKLFQNKLRQSAASLGNLS